MALTDQEIGHHWRIANLEDDSWMPQIHERFARAIESAAAAPLLARIAELKQAAVERTVHNNAVAEVQEKKIAELEHEAELRMDLHRTANVMIGERDSRIAALTAQVEQDNWRTYATERETTAQEVIERHRSEQDGLMHLLKQAREQVEQAAQPVAAQQRFRHHQKTEPDWSPWQSCNVSDRPAWQIDSQGYEVEYRVLYTAPPKAVPLTETQIRKEHEPGPVNLWDGTPAKYGIAPADKPTKGNT